LLLFLLNILRAKSLWR